jgi:hypothetical protein
MNAFLRAIVPSVTTRYSFCYRVPGAAFRFQRRVSRGGPGMKLRLTVLPCVFMLFLMIGLPLMPQDGGTSIYFGTVFRIGVPGVQ